MSVDPLSVISLRAETFFGELRISSATAFVYRRNDKNYLVSNWHVFSGRDHRTGQPLDKSNGAIPDSISMTIHGHNILRYFHGATVDLIDKDGEILWAQHKEFGQKVDVAVIPLDIDTGNSEQKLYAYGDIIIDDAINYSAGHDVFIIGFPRGIGLQGIFPIWKRGSIASDPALGMDAYPGFLVDSATREGMSGAPVYRRTWNVANYEDGGISMGPGIFTRLLGVYSGRYGANDEFLAQIGRVWGIELVNEIIDAPVRGSYELY